MKNLIVLTIVLMFPTFAASTETGKKDGLNDAEIAHIVVTANRVDIDAGNFAKKKAN
jgi:putative membrane protein